MYDCSRLIHVFVCQCDGRVIFSNEKVRGKSAGAWASTPSTSFTLANGDHLGQVKNDLVSGPLNIA